jgi:hypothetical protein
MPRIPILGTRWRWVVSFTPRPFYPRGKSPSFPLDRKLGRPQSRRGRGGEEKKLSSPYRESKPSRQARSLVTILSYPGSLWRLSILERKDNKEVVKRIKTLPPLRQQPVASLPFFSAGIGVDVQFILLRREKLRTHYGHGFSDHLSHSGEILYERFVSKLGN